MLEKTGFWPSVHLTIIYRTCVDLGSVFVCPEASMGRYRRTFWTGKKPQSHVWYGNAILKSEFGRRKACDAHPKAFSRRSRVRTYVRGLVFCGA